ncbi:RagB/SusD family nutrient uptake outer membrane protein [Salegentibacter sp. JZCK2]|uniref:RagB/SusD family nutrient uptake outer membrane protein n=1 Tax=Salegentibacter tibetensis TaxID=2873600 RepID=UPI001CCA8436|nr:RagB/SusD family nutrient uptake outer membrane protein [Salegentibacter tibetensis]MBZ9730768.1 RagB/SusD family nutrient uptake outer membrane protein [Salegentibacter tibetensis]
MKNKTIFRSLSVFAISLMLISCEDFVEVETPGYKLDSEAVFASDQTAQSALDGIFNQLFNTSFVNGGNQSVTFTAGLSADNFSVTTTTQEVVEFHQNQIIPTNSYNLTLWSGAYNMIYMVNAMLAGIEDNPSLSQDLKDHMEGSGKFIRGLTYFNLVNLYGDVPLLLGTGYQENALASRTSSEIVYNQILEDLENASVLLDENYLNEDRTRPNRFSVLALLARVHLFLGNWEEAEYYNSQVIGASELYEILNDPNEVFLANSREAIWQISPIGWGNSFTHTREGNLFIKNATANTPVVLSESFLNAFENSQDKRHQEWVSTFIAEEDTLHFPYKYKIQYDASSGELTEYSMVLRLAEQYLIRAEARARLGNLPGAIQDLNIIRSRAGIPSIEESQPLNSEDELLEMIILERRRELFAEWGHRWFDLNRLGKSEILANKENSNWNSSSNLFPIPSSERIKNPNLSQNPGY